MAEVVGFPIDEKKAEEIGAGTWMAVREVIGVVSKLDDGRWTIVYRGLVQAKKAKGVVIMPGQSVFVAPKDLGTGCYPLNSLIAQAGPMRKAGIALSEGKADDEMIFTDVMGYDLQVIEIKPIMQGQKVQL